MKNKFLLQQFMDKNNLEFNKPFLVKTDYDCINKVKCRITEKDGEWGVMPQIEYYNDKKEEWIETSMHWLILVMFGEDFKITLLNQEQKDMKNSTAIGTNWDDFKKEVFTKEEIEKSDKRVKKIMKRIEKKIRKKK